MSAVGFCIVFQCLKVFKKYLMTQALCGLCTVQSKSQFLLLPLYFSVEIVCPSTCVYFYRCFFILLSTSVWKGYVLLLKCCFNTYRITQFSWFLWAKADLTPMPSSKKWINKQKKKFEKQKLKMIWVCFLRIYNLKKPFVYERQPKS